ncbi:hypothetical protein, partial [Mycobacterium tuberculosis]
MDYASQRSQYPNLMQYAGQSRGTQSRNTPASSCLPIPFRFSLGMRYTSISASAYGARRLQARADYVTIWAQGKIADGERARGMKGTNE